MREAWMLHGGGGVRKVEIVKTLPTGNYRIRAYDHYRQRWSKYLRTVDPTHVMGVIP